MRIGLIGLGRIGAFHARTLVGLDAVDSLVVADAAPGRADAVAAEVGAEAAGSPGELLRAGVDGVVVAAATNAHVELIDAAVRAGLPTLCEKPIAGSIGEAEQLAARVRAAGVPVAIGYQRRYDAGYRAAHDAVRSGELGFLHTVRATTLDPAPPPKEYVAVSGGIFRDCAVHDLDALRFVIGAEVRTVYATGSNQGDPFFAEVGDVDTAATILTFEDDTIALMSNSRYNPRGYDCRMELHGSKDSIAVGLEERLPLRSVEPGATFPSGEPWSFFMDRFVPAYQAEMAAFVDVVAGRAEPACTVEDALQTAYVAEACVRSLAEGRPVDLAEVKA